MSFNDDAWIALAQELQEGARRIHRNPLPQRDWTAILLNIANIRPTKKTNMFAARSKEFPI